MEYFALNYPTSHLINVCILIVYYSSVKDIQNLEIISTEEAGNVNDTHSKVIVKRPIAKRAGRSISECVPNILQAGSSQTQMNFKKPPEPNQPLVEQTPNGKIPPSTRRIYDLYIYTGVCVSY